jgi:hypothetical protein
VNAVTDSTGKDTGALVVEGSAGIEKALFVGGAVTTGVAGAGTIKVKGELKYPRRDRGFISGMAWGGGKFVAVGNSGKGAYSTDGVTWTAISNIGTGYLYVLAYGGPSGQEKFVAAGDGGKGAYSSDGGVTWKNFATSTSGIENNMTNVTYAAGKFVAINNDMWCFYSSDGVNWTEFDIVPGSKGEL